MATQEGQSVLGVPPSLDLCADAATAAAAAAPHPLQPRSRAQSLRESIASERFFEDDVEEPTGTVGSSSINLANTILGSGMLSMANAMAALGLIFGSL
ncbi:hypothetical protein H4S02_011885, partial [Coemansia sp. RSA 2611]